MCKLISDEKFITDAIDFCENRPFNIVSLTKNTIDDLLEYDKIPDWLEDYCIHVLAYNPEPTIDSYVRNYWSQWNEDTRR